MCTCASPFSTTTSHSVIQSFSQSAMIANSLQLLGARQSWVLKKCLERQLEFVSNINEFFSLSLRLYKYIYTFIYIHMYSKQQCLHKACSMLQSRTLLLFQYHIKVRSYIHTYIHTYGMQMWLPSQIGWRNVVVANSYWRSSATAPTQPALYGYNYAYVFIFT